MKIVISLCFFILSWYSATCCTSVYQPMACMNWEQFADNDDTKFVSNDLNQSSDQALQSELNEEDDEQEASSGLIISGFLLRQFKFPIEVRLNPCYQQQIHEPPCNK